MDDTRKLAAIARVVGDPTRAMMLWSLMGGESRPAGELALIAGVSNQTASNHLAQLRSAELLALRVRGRSHFYQLRDASVAKALEALMHVVNPELTPVKGTASRVAPGLLLARTCYDHLAGRLAVRIGAKMKRERWLLQKGEDFVVSTKGERHLLSFGIELKAASASRRRYAYPCLDWSERLAHIGGHLGSAILNWLIAEKALVRVEGSRAMRVTGYGRTLLEKTFDLRIGMDGSTVTSPGSRGHRNFDGLRAVYRVQSSVTSRTADESRG
jgi:DNA-binding transcriptional ArsR family regulator